VTQSAERSWQRQPSPTGAMAATDLVSTPRRAASLTRREGGASSRRRACRGDAAADRRGRELLRRVCAQRVGEVLEATSLGSPCWSGQGLRPSGRKSHYGCDDGRRPPIGRPSVPPARRWWPPTTPRSGAPSNVWFSNGWRARHLRRARQEAKRDCGQRLAANRLSRCQIVLSQCAGPQGVTDDLLDQCLFMPLFQQDAGDRRAEILQAN
jgi:hypothetical protein